MDKLGINGVHAYETLGCHKTKRKSSHRFAVWAPNARHVALVGDFNAWDINASPMNRINDGVWDIEIYGLENGAIYKYAITSQLGETVFKSDPFAFHAETGPATGSKVWSIDGYSWTDADWMKARKRYRAHEAPISIYELHIGSWKNPNADGYPWYRTIADDLAKHCKAMGFTHVELMPVTEYPYDGSWGYQTTGYFAPTSRYGTPQDFMYFVDKLHSAGIAVILDWSAAHFPRDLHGLYNFDGTPIFEGSDKLMAEHPEWGTLIFDYSRQEVRNFLVSSVMFFFEKYHIDGLRVDAVSSMLYLDYGRGNNYHRNKNGGNINLHAIELLREMNSTVLSAFPGTITIAEESTSFPLITFPPYDGGLGFSFKWDMGFMHDTLDYFSADAYFRKDMHDKLTFSMVYAFSESYVLPFSHDEVVHGKKSMLGKMYGDNEQKFATLRALFGYMYAHPGKKLLFMGQEFGQYIEWNYKQELDWFLLDYPAHYALRAWVAVINKFYARHPELYEIDNSWDGFEWKSVDENERSSIAFIRRDKSGKALLCAFNFTPVPQTIYVPLPKGSRLKALLSSNEERFCGTGEKHTYKKGYLSLPPMCAIYFSF